MAESRFLGPLHVVDHGGAGGTIVLVHGLGGSHVNWTLVAKRLATAGRVVAVDLPGFGRSAPVPRCDLDAHVSAVSTTIDSFGGRAILVGNSMGGLASMLVAAQRPELVEALVLVAPAAPLPRFTVPANPWIAARLAAQSLPGVGPALTDALRRRLTPSQLVKLTFDSITSKPVAPDAFDEAVDLADIRRSYPWVGRAFSESAASVRSWILHPGRYVDMTRSIERPALITWGDRDPVVPPKALQALARHRPDWETRVFEGVGHVPQLEMPVLFGDTLLDWWARVDVWARK